MAGFHDILGHEQIIAHLQNAIEEDKVIFSISEL